MKTLMPPEYVAALAAVKAAIADANEATIIAGAANEAKISADATFDKLSADAVDKIAKARATLEIFRTFDTGSTP